MYNYVVDIDCENDPGFGMCAEVVRELKKSHKWGPAKVIRRQDKRTNIVH